MSNEIHEVIIIGSGPSGLTAAVYASRANLSPVLIHGPIKGGQLTTTTDVENFPGFPEGIMGPELMVAMEKQAVKFGTTIITDTIKEVNFDQSPYQLIGDKGTYQAKTVIISTGANPRYLGIPGEKELLGYGVSTCATCDGAFFRDETIAVIGGGDSACEEATFLTKFAKKVYLIHRRDELRASKIMQERVFKNEKIEVLWDTVTVSANGKKPSGLESISIKNSKSGEERDIEATGMFVAIGHTPNSQIFSDYLKLNEQGYIILPNKNSTATSIPGVYACGDVQDFTYRQAITAAGTGCMSAIEAERYLESLE